MKIYYLHLYTIINVTHIQNGSYENFEYFIFIILLKYDLVTKFI